MKSFFIKMEIPLNEEEELFLESAINSGKFKIMGECYQVESISYDFESDSDKFSNVTVSGF